MIKVAGRYSTGNATFIMPVATYGRGLIVIAALERTLGRPDHWHGGLLRELAEQCPCHFATKWEIFITARSLPAGTERSLRLRRSR